MKLYSLINQYVSYRKALGEKFKTNESCLNAFCKLAGVETSLETINEEMVRRYLYSKSTSVTTGWFVRHSALLGFYQYVVSRNYVTEIPLPKILPKRPQNIVPYIYSQEELKLLFEGALTYQKNKSHIAPYMVQVALMLTYMLGLRVHETISITLVDVDMDNLVITIRESKFYKSRLVPFNQQIKGILHSFLKWRKSQKQPESPDAELLMNAHNQPLNAASFRGIFQRIRDNAGIKRVDGACFQPRLHDLRHSYATNRLISWYREGKDINKLLPFLSTYLGHKYLAHTSVYLTMTDDLLGQANVCFEKYAKGGES